MVRRNLVLLAGLAGWTAFRARRRVIAPLLRLPPARFSVGVRYNIRIPMPDGVTLAADHHYPMTEGQFPTILIRTPYGRGRSGGIAGLSEGFKAQRFAERGYHVIVQDVRGRYDSEGQFEPFTNEAADGLATLEWIAAQPWFNGSVGMFGQSYLGYTGWAVAADAPPYLKALMPVITASQFYSTVYPDGAYALNSGLRWAYLTEFVGTKRGWINWRTLPHTRKLMRGQIFKPAYFHLPLREADRLVARRAITPYRDSLSEVDPDALRWKAADHSGRVAQVNMPIHLISGWYDVFQRELLADYRRLKDAGKKPYLTIGPWSHVDQRIYRVALREGLAWFDAHLKGDRSLLRKKAVRVYVMGAHVWRTLDEWPPPAREQRFYLHPDRWLSIDAPGLESSCVHYRFDPADPTPSIGGTTIFPPSGPTDHSEIEARPDVLVYTTAPLVEPLEIIGAVRLELFVRSSLAHTDFVGRLCDVYPDGQSINICDGLLRIEPGKGERQPDGSLRVIVEMWSTAYAFKKYHRIRLHVCSAAHPRWSRNLGTGEPIATGTRMQAADQTVFHDRAHPSALVVPVTRGSG